MRIGKIGLSDYLHSINAVESPACQLCGAPRQTIQHVLFNCDRLRDLREEVLWDGGRVERRSNSLDDVLSDKVTAVRAANFMIQTNMLRQFQWVRGRVYHQIEELPGAGSPLEDQD